MYKFCVDVSSEKDVATIEHLTLQIMTSRPRVNSHKGLFPWPPGPLISLAEESLNWEHHTHLISLEKDMDIFFNHRYKDYNKLTKMAIQAIEVVWIAYYPGYQ